MGAAAVLDTGVLPAGPPPGSPPWHPAAVNARPTLPRSLSNLPVPPTHPATLCHPLQVIFRNIHKLLLDTATSEFFFCLDFFEDEGVFRDVCQPIIAIVEGDLATATHEQVDLLGICLMIRLNHEHRRMMVKRK